MMRENGLDKLARQPLVYDEEKKLRCGNVHRKDGGQVEKVQQQMQEGRKRAS